MSGFKIIDCRLCLTHGEWVPHFCSQWILTLIVHFGATRRFSLSIFSTPLDASRAAGSISILLTTYSKKNKYSACYTRDDVVQNVHSFLYTLPYWNSILKHLLLFLSMYRFCHFCISASLKNMAWMCPYCCTYLPSEGIPATDIATTESTYWNWTECKTWVCSLEQ